MVDIILAEYGGSAWLVRGDRYIDDLLVNTLPDEISIEIITCEAKSDIDELWRQEDGRENSGRLPWLIHPGILGRIRGKQSASSVLFGQWSVLLDDAAKAVIGAVASAAEQSSDAEVLLISYIHADQPKTMIDLTNLRYSLIEAELTRLGVAPSRIVRENRDGGADANAGAGNDRVDLQIGKGQPPR